MNAFFALSVWPRRRAVRGLLMRRVLSGFLLAGAVTAPAYAADAPLYAFVDADGILHITDRLADVPEPYYTVYKQRRPSPAADSDADPARTTPRRRPVPAAVDVAAPAADQQARARAQWQQLMATWRDKLSQSTLALQQAEAEAQGASNPILRETPVGRQRWQATQARVAQWRGKAVEARRMLLETLPSRAKREHVPPQWLLP